MTTPWILVSAIGVLAGVIGALTRLRAPFTIIPILVLGLGVDIRLAIAASLVTVVATTSNCTVAYLRNGCSNIETAISAVAATALGAWAGAVVSAQAPPAAIAAAFLAVLLYSAHLLWCSRNTSVQGEGCSTARMSGPAEGPGARRDPAGVRFMFLAGCLSGLVGIGPAAAEIIEMDRSLRRPESMSGTTAQFMVGVTAAISASVFLQHGYMNEDLALALVIGVYLGTVSGAAARSYADARPRRAAGSRVPRVVAGPLAISTSGLRGTTKYTR